MTDYSNILIRASAGTGKTYRLSNRYLGLLHRGVRPDQILATTFTRKAAGEILDRVIIRLAEATRDDKACRKLADELDEPALDRAQSLRLLRTMIRQLHRLRICTLDAFFAQLAGSCSLELALPPGWRIIETVHDNNLRREAIAMTLQGDSQREIERLLHLMAKGEAKRSISDMIQSTVNDLYDIYRETTQEAWQPLGRPKPLADAALEQAVDTLAEAPLPKHATAKKTRDKSVEAARNGDWELFIKNGLVDKVLSDDLLYSSKPLPDELVDAYQVLLAHARAVLLRQVADQTEATYALLDKFHSAYDKLKRDARSLQFNDVTHTLTHGSALTNIQHQQFRLDASIDHLLLDEFQDTSLAQWQVVRPFAQKVTRHVQNEQNRHASSFFCVGDVKQAIYGWRGGLSEIFDALQDEITDLTETAMDVSYRSAQPVIDTVNEVFSNLYRHPKLENDVVDWCNAFQPHTTARNDLGGYVTLGTGPATQEGEQAKDVKALYTAEQIREFVSQAPGCSIGVLVRSNDIVAQLIYELHRLGVPASEEGGNPLTDSPAVQTLLSLLKIVDHPADTVARFHVATSPLGPLLSYSDFRQTDSTLRLAQQIRSDLVENGYGPTIQAWTQLLKPLCDSRDRNRLQQLVEIAYAYAPQATLRTDDFLAYLDAERVTDPTTAEVRVMTVHQSKGLQFDIVVLPDLDRLLTGQSDNCVVGQPSPTAPIDTVCLYRNEQIQKLLPPKIQKMFDTCARRNINEALCVLYVALTRAIHALHIIISPSAPNERTLSKTSAGLLRAALTDGNRLEPLTLAYDCGDPQWHRKLKKKPSPTPAPEVPQADVVVKLAPMKCDSRLEHSTPSQLEGGRRVVGNRLLNFSSSIATARGTVIHALFEQIKWLEDGVPDRSKSLQIARRLSDSNLDPARLVDDFEKMLSMPAIDAILRRDFYRPADGSGLSAFRATDLVTKHLKAQVFTERRFVAQDTGTQDQSRLLSGTIDRLVLLYNGESVVAADILDYKTDSLADESQTADSVAADSVAATDKLVAHYRPQLEAYRRAIGSMYGLPLELVSARLLFVARGIVRTI